MLALGASAAAPHGAVAVATPPAGAASMPKAKPGARVPAVRLVDVNSASRQALMTLPGIGAAEAGRIVAGRPYLTKAHLVTHKALTMAQYQAIAGSIIARQRTQPAAGAKKGKS